MLSEPWDKLCSSPFSAQSPSHYHDAVVAAASHAPEETRPAFLQALSCLALENPLSESANQGWGAQGPHRKASQDQEDAAGHPWSKAVLLPAQRPASCAAPRTGPERAALGEAVSTEQALSAGKENAVSGTDNISFSLDQVARKEEKEDL